MANDGFFKCETPGCDYVVKMLVPDWMKVLERRCPRCGGNLRKT